MTFFHPVEKIVCFFFCFILFLRKTNLLVTGALCSVLGIPRCISPCCREKSRNSILTSQTDLCHGMFLADTAAFGAQADPSGCQDLRQLSQSLWDPGKLGGCSLFNLERLA